jgi:ribonuclease P protein component
MRFRPEQHLRRQSDIRAPRERGTRADCQTFTVWHLRRNPSPTAGTACDDLPRVCVVASGAAVGCAVLRNRAKRRLREIFRRHQDLIPRQTDLVIVARSAVNRRPFTELERKFTDACRRIAATPAP